MRKAILLCLVTLVGINILGADAMASETCWRDSYGRSVGTIPSQCDMYQENQGLLCYPKCQRGYTGVLNVCWQDCPTGSRDDGAFCRYAEYGRGAGYPWKFGDTAFSLDDARARCRRDNLRGCEKYGEIIYPKCKPGYSPFGCCICRPKNVNCADMAGRLDLSCTKKTYTRSTITASCSGGKENDAGLCYPKCKSGYKGVGPVCWGECPTSHPVNCGASCAKTQAACAEAVTDQVVSVVDVAANIAITVGTLGTGTGAKAAASAGAKAAKIGAKQAAKFGAKQGLKTAARQGLKQAGKKLSRAQIKASLREVKQAAIRKGGEAAREARKMDEDKLEKLVDVLDKAQSTVEAAEDGLDPLEIAEIMDPTGLVAVVNAYNNPICSSPGLTTASATTEASTRPSATLSVLPTAYQRLQNRWVPAEYVHNQNKKLESGTIQAGWWSAQWTIEKVPNSSYVRLKNHWTGEYIHNQNRRLEIGTIEPGWWSAQWTIEKVPNSSYVRLKNRWTGEYIHNQNRRLEIGTVKPGWWSAQWVLQSVR